MLTDAEFPFLIQQIVEDLAFVRTKGSAASKYKSALIQALASCFHYDSEWTFKVLGTENLFIFEEWFKIMGTFKKDFELRRNILGLAALLKTPASVIPQIVAERIGDMLR